MGNSSFIKWPQDSFITFLFKKVQAKLVKSIMSIMLIGLIGLTKLIMLIDFIEFILKEYVVEFPK